MITKSILIKSTILFLFIILLIIGCTKKRDDLFGPTPFPTDPEVFTDEFGSSVTFEAFLGSQLNAVQLTQDSTYNGIQALEITVPDSGSALGSFAGGAFTTGIARDLTGYNALTFWAKANRTMTLNVAGIGNDNTGNSKFTAEVNNLNLTTSWQKFVIPIPLSEKLETERGLFYFAEGPENGVGGLIWFDEIIFDSLQNITNPRPAIDSTTVDVEVGQEISPGNGIVTFDVNGSDIDVSAMPSYFSFTSSDSAIVSIDSLGVISGAGVGTATLTATLGNTSATGNITVNVTVALAVPTIPAPTPTVDPTDVISLFSDSYTNETVNRWSADWDNAEYADITIGSDNVKKYFDLDFAGIEFTSPTVDVSSMTHFHIDVWTPHPTDAPALFKIKLVDFGANGVFDLNGGDDVEHELIFDENTMSTESWVSIDIPLAAFTNLITKEHLAQMIISGDLPTVYLDNIYFYDAGIPTEPLVSAPTPMYGDNSVISIFSDQYMDVTVDTWSSPDDDADYVDATIGIDNLKKYTALNFAIIEFTSNTLDITSMSHFHMDVWTPDPTAAPAVFKVKLVDFGANGVYDGGGDDVEHELTVDENTMLTNSWVSIDIPIDSFVNLTTKEHLAQLIISGDPNTVFVDNIYFYQEPASQPSIAAPTPTVPEVDVISIFSNEYTDISVDSYSATWDDADVTPVVINSNLTIRYTNLNFAGIEFTGDMIDASSMTHFHMDVWTPDPTVAPALLKIKLVDFGPNGIGENGGGDDAEHEITLTENIMNTGSWVSIEIPLSDFLNLVTKEHIAQLIISGDPNTVFVDNIYFHK